MITKTSFNELREVQLTLKGARDTEGSREKTLGDLDGKIMNLELRLDNALRDVNATFDSVKTLESALEGARREREELAATPPPDVDYQALQDDVEGRLADMSPIVPITREERLTSALSAER